MAAGNSTAADLGAYVCFEDEAGQGLRPPKGRTWARRGARPTVRVRGGGRHRLGTPVVWVWDRSVHLVQERYDFAEESKEWSRVFQLPGYAPELNPTEAVWSLLKRSIANFAAPDLDRLTRIVKRRLKKLQYRPGLLDGCLAGTGLTLEPG